MGVRLCGWQDRDHRQSRKGVACYDPGYTFVEKLQTISTKFRQQQESKGSPIDFMRHYYDVYSLLQHPGVQGFIGTEAYKAHKERRFRQGDNPDITKNEAFILSDPGTRAAYQKAYDATSALYYGGKPTFDEVLKAIGVLGEPAVAYSRAVPAAAVATSRSPCESPLVHRRSSEDPGNRGVTASFEAIPNTLDAEFG